MPAGVTRRQRQTSCPHAVDAAFQNVLAIEMHFCPEGGGSPRMSARIEDPQLIRKILEHRHWREAEDALSADASARQLGPAILARSR